MPAGAGVCPAAAAAATAAEADALSALVNLGYRRPEAQRGGRARSLERLGDGRGAGRADPRRA